MDIEGRRRRPSFFVAGRACNVKIAALPPK